MGLLICGSCVLGYVKVKRTPHLGFTPAYIALMSAVYWLLRNKWAVYCKCGLAARLCVMYSLTCIVLAVSLMYYMFTVSKVIVMRITLHFDKYLPFVQYYCAKTLSNLWQIFNKTLIQQLIQWYVQPIQFCQIWQNDLL